MRKYLIEKVDWDKQENSDYYKAATFENKPLREYFLVEIGGRKKELEGLTEARNYAKVEICKDIRNKAKITLVSEWEDDVEYDTVSVMYFDEKTFSIEDRLI